MPIPTGTSWLASAGRLMPCMDHCLAAAQHARAAALHLGATDDRAGYWRLLGEAELCIGRPAEGFLQMATRHALGLVGHQAQPDGTPTGI